MIGNEGRARVVSGAYDPEEIPWYFPQSFRDPWGTYLGYIGMSGLKVSRVWFFTRFGHDWPGVLVSKGYVIAL